ncbi:MAG: GDP-mannose 4,6-dehydratase [Gammaproteobacteria bacterium]|nr:GDP-mannose 4,6-dehydratase [Gammaproteobacteria bacterium]
MNKILITGITGFIGGELAHKLAGKAEVHGIFKPSRSRDYRPLSTLEGQIHTHELDISDYAATENLLQKIKPDKIVHAAALSPVRASFDNPLDYLRVNVNGTVNLIQGLLKLENYQERRFIFASTAEVYGLQTVEEPFVETLALEPSSPYACTKAFGDMYLRMCHDVYGLDTVVMRCVNTFGRKYDKSFFIEYLIDRMLHDTDVHIGAPESIRDYMWVDDHVNAYLLALDKTEATGEVFNVSTGVGVRNIDVAYQLADIIGFDKNKIHTNKYPHSYPGRPITSDQPYLVLNSSKIRNLLGWPEPTSLDVSLRRAVDYWRSETG